MAKAIGTTNDPTKAFSRMLERANNPKLNREEVLTIEWAVQAFGLHAGNPGDIVTAYAAIVKTGQDESALRELAAQSAYVASRKAVAAAIDAAEVAQSEYRVAADTLSALPAEVTAPVLEALASKLGLSPDGLPILPDSVVDDIWQDTKGHRLAFAPVIESTESSVTTK